MENDDRDVVFQGPGGRRLEMFNMAESENCCPTQNLKNTKIVVSVEEALEDLLVVSFTYGTTSFQGVLLNSTKKNWPLGVMPPGSSYSSSEGDATVKCQPQQPGATSLDQDKLFAVRRRFTYFQGTELSGQVVNPCAIMPRRTYCRRFADKNARTMRLRPRQVLCSKCKSICNENSENVEVANAKKETIRTPPVEKTDESVGLRSDVASNTDRKEQVAQQKTGRNLAAGRMVLRKRRLSEQVSTAAVAEATALVSVAAATVAEATVDPVAKKPREVAPSLETLSASEVVTDDKQQPLAKTSPFIKISFGPQGTVLKIPPRTHNYSASDNEADFQDVSPENGSSPAYKHARAKAARKALKKAKKDAQKKVAFANSPLRQDVTLLEMRRSRHHKHRFKHKKRHKDEDDSDRAGPPPSSTTTSATRNTVCAGSGDCNGVVVEIPIGESDQRNGHDLESEELILDHWDMNTTNGMKSNTYSEIKKECLRQKLSISLKRLSEKSYMNCGPTCNNNNNHEDSNGSGGSNHSDSNSNSEAGDLPEFPESEPPKDLDKVRPLMMRISSYHVGSCSLLDGRTISVGDVVWGKIHGFPWWPGKVLSISVSQRDNGILVMQQAHVAWFGSSTSSHMPCNQLVPFLEDFKVRYNKKKRGPYKEAIKQATLAAQQVLKSVGLHT